MQKNLYKSCINKFCLTPTPVTKSTKIKQKKYFSHSTIHFSLNTHTHTSNRFFTNRFGIKISLSSKNLSSCVPVTSDEIIVNVQVQPAKTPYPKKSEIIHKNQNCYINLEKRKSRIY